MDVIQAIRERRAINFFEAGKEMSDDNLKELLSIANLSPSSINPAMEDYCRARP